VIRGTQLYANQPKMISAILKVTDLLL
jgi:hypothetical protein